MHSFALSLLLFFSLHAFGQTNSGTNSGTRKVEANVYLDKRGTKELPLLVETAQSEDDRNELQAKAKERKEKVDVDNYTLALAACSAIIALFMTLIAALQLSMFKRQLSLMKVAIGDGTTAADSAKLSADALSRSAKISETTMIAGNRAYVGVDTIREQYRQGYGGTELLYSFAPIWNNYGNTPTRHMMTFVKSELIDADVEVNFEFYMEQAVVGAQGIGPSVKLTGAFAPQPGLTREQLLGIHHGRQKLYIWGWAKYGDIFSNSQSHITRFCIQICVNYNPNPDQQNPTAHFDFVYLIAPHHNCSDEECINA